MIPKIIHWVWPGHDPIPHRYRAYAETWKTHHPDWEHRLWTPTEIDGLNMVNRDLYDAAETEAPNDWLRWRADIVRLEIIFRHGGIYVDADAECLKPFDSLLEHGCWLAESPNAPGHATQAVFGAEPEHPFINYAVHQLGESADYNAGMRINHRVGSRFIDRMYQASGRDVELLPWRWLAGQSIKDREQGKQPDLSDAFCWHRYDNTDRHRSAKRQVAAFRAAADVLDGAGVEWFLTSGLLLGHIRDGRILPWDGDVDIGIWPKDVERVREAFKGWPFKRNFDSQMWPVHNGVKIDIHTHYQDGDQVFKLHGKRQDIRMSHPAFDLAPTIFYLRECLMPSPPEAYLEHMYGSDWTTPKKEWQWDRDPLNIES